MTTQTNPMIFKLEKPKEKVLKDIKEKNNVVLSSTINYPLNSLGFHYFINRTRSAMNITKSLETKTEFYYVVNPFETQILNYDDSINNLGKVYLDLKSDNENLKSHIFYKIWEILFSFDIANDKDLDIGIISNNSKIIEDSVELYRNKLITGSKTNIKVATINEIKGGSGKGRGRKQKGGSITLKGAQDLIIADMEYEPEVQNMQEQETYQLFVSEIYTALSNLNKGGSFVVKIWDTYTNITIKLIWILTSFFSESYIYKPFFSRQTTSERYLICKEFNKSITATELKIFENIIKEINSEQWIFDIFPMMELNPLYLDLWKYQNNKIVNQQQIVINKIVRYIKENVYFGDAYHQYRQNQINNTQWWVQTFFPSSNLISKNKEKIIKENELSIERNKSDIEKLASILVKN